MVHLTTSTSTLLSSYPAKFADVCVIFLVFIFMPQKLSFAADRCAETTRDGLIIEKDCNDLRWTDGDVTINKEVTVASERLYAVDANVPEYRHYYNLTNNGLIKSIDTGLNNNSASFINVINLGTISGERSAITNSGTIGAITNSGTIGSVTNNESSVIDAITNNERGVVGTITNLGTISTITNSGVMSTITNDERGVISTITNNERGFISGKEGGKDYSLDLQNRRYITIVDNYGILQGSVNLGISSLNIYGSSARVEGDVNGNGDVSVMHGANFTTEGNFSARSFTNQGTLNLGHTIFSDVANDGTLNLQAGSSIAGNVTGAGDVVVKSGATFTTAGSFTDSSFTNQGTLNLGHSVSTGIANSGTLNLQAGSSIAGNVTGAGDVVVKSGATFTTAGSFTDSSFTNQGTLNLGHSVSTGIANSGTLNLQAGSSIAGNVIGTGDVNVTSASNFTSGGSFDVHSFGVADTAIFNMNNSITVSNAFTNAGRLVLSSSQAVVGNYNQTSTGVIQIALDGSTFSKLSVTSIATFTGYSLLSIVIKPGSEPISGHTYGSILSASSIAGVTSLSSKVFIENPSESYKYTIVQNGNNLDLIVDSDLTPAVNSIDPPRANQANSLIQLAMITTQAVRDRLNWMSGSAYQGTTVDNRLWITPYTSWGRQNDDVAAYKQKISGVIIGGDKPLNDNFYVGGSFAIGGSSLKGTEAISHENFSAKNYQAILYSKYSFADSWHLKNYLMAGINKSDLSRYDVTLASDANASLTGYYAGVNVSLEKEFQVSEKQKIIPTIGLNYVSSLINKYKDSLDSVYERQTAKSLVYSIGGMYQYSFDASDRFQLNYERGYDPLAKQGILNSTNDDHQQYKLFGAVTGHQNQNVGVNYHRTIKPNSFLDFDYHVMTSTNYKAEMVSASFHYMF